MNPRPRKRIAGGDSLLCKSIFIETFSLANAISRSLKTRDRYTRNYQQLLHLAPSIRSLINDRTKARELTKVTQKVSICYLSAHICCTYTYNR